MSDLHLNDIDPLETQEWMDALDTVLEAEGTERAHFLLEKLIDKARQNLNRFEDINAQNEGSVAQTLLNLAVPQLVIGVLDASPFYIAYGTNMIQKYAQFRNENDLIKKSALFEKMNVTPRIVWKDTAGVFRQIGILRSNPTSTLLESPEFIHSVVFPSLLDK